MYAIVRQWVWQGERGKEGRKEVGVIGGERCALVKVCLLDNYD